MYIPGMQDERIRCILRIMRCIDETCIYIYISRGGLEDIPLLFMACEKKEQLVLDERERGEKICA